MKRSWNLNPDEFRSALAKGLGRAALHVREHRLPTEHEQAPVAACLKPTHWFNSDEEAVAWLLDIVDLAGMRDVVAGAVLEEVSLEGAHLRSARAKIFSVHSVNPSKSNDGLMGFQAWTRRFNPVAYRGRGSRGGCGRSCCPRLPSPRSRALPDL